ncbi:Enoyl-CoA delta isomerase 1 [Blattella germanica]|nr:Enoyl-CoA delta isomerase 1 [Blattella germanica]
MSLGRLYSFHTIKCMRPNFVVPVSINKLSSNVPCGRNFSSSEKLVDVSINEKTGISTVTMQRLPVNSLNLELLRELCTVFDALEKDKSRGMILTSGHSPAGGCLLALSCEYRVMVGPKYTIGLNETQLGIVAPKWFEYTMSNVIPKRQTELALTFGRMFSSEEAHKLGLVDELAVDKADAIAKAETFLSGMSKIPAAARNFSKLTCRQEPLEWMKRNKEKDLQQFLGLVSAPAVQRGLELYMQSLKKK